MKDIIRVSDLSSIYINEYWDLAPLRPLHLRLECWIYLDLGVLYASGT